MTARACRQPWRRAGAIAGAMASAMAGSVAGLLALGAGPLHAATPGHYANFRVAVYVTVGDTRRLSHPEVFEREFARAQSQARFDKVYVEVYRDHQFASDAQIDATVAAFRARGVQVAGGATLAAGGKDGQFGTFDYEDAADRAECQRAVVLAARHFDEVILDDFFFYTSKSDADIAARGSRSWTDYRLATMRAASRDLVLKPAHAANPRVRVIIKYPNWYEHFHGLGYDLEQQAKLFDGIYTGTETRDPEDTDQLLQQYESYSIIRYFNRLRPDGATGGNGGGWVDTYSTRYIDRYAEQLWDTLFAKAAEITLFNWRPMAEAKAVEPGERPWAGRPSSFEWGALLADYPQRSASDPGPGWGAAAGHALRQADAVLGALGTPVGIASYRPHHASGEDFLHNYLGNIGLPIEVTPEFPAQAPVVLLTQAAAKDARILERIEQRLVAGGRVVITSGLLQALQGHGIERLAEISATGNVAAIAHYLDGYGAGSGRSLDGEGDEPQPVLFPELRFYTNDSWPILRGVASAHGYPLMLMNRYSRGALYVLAIPENMGDLYKLPAPLLDQLRAYLLGDFPVRIEAPARVALFCYDNDTFVVESFRDEPVDIGVSVLGHALGITDLGGGDAGGAVALVDLESRSQPGAAVRTQFATHLEAHSFRAFRIERAAQGAGATP